jgi:hypothetical protein
MKRRIVLAFSFIGLLGVACASTPGDDDRVRASGPDPTAYITDVNPVFERRCATLDCHGAVGRAMRLYSSNGLRIPNDAGRGPGGGSTTPEEIRANYYSIISLEPDKMTAVSKDKGDPSTLLILRKGRNVDGAHKGGPALFTNDDADTCITSWIKGKVAQQSCALAARPF